jgi:RNA polymerase sigma-70 factor (ECF subfamily)
VVDGDRDDLFQEIFIRIHRAAHQYRVDRPLHPWLFTIVANRVRTYHRRRRVRELVASQPIKQEPRDRSPNGERVAEAKQTVAWLEEEMRRLSPVQREVLVLACVESLPLREVAEALDIPLNTVKTHLRRARTTLVRKLARRHRSAGGEVHHE